MDGRYRSTIVDSQWEGVWVQCEGVWIECGDDIGCHIVSHVVCWLCPFVCRLLVYFVPIGGVCISAQNNNQLFRYIAQI